MLARFRQKQVERGDSDEMAVSWWEGPQNLLEHRTPHDRGACRREWLQHLCAYVLPTDARRRAIIAGPPLRERPGPWAALDARLANRLPDIELLTCGGRGVSMLTASYAAERGLTVTARVADFARFPLDAGERRDAFLVNEADAAVVVWAYRDSDVRRVLALVERKGMSLHVRGAPEKKPKVKRREPEPDAPSTRGLSD
jgi:hypothetical protein